MQFSVQCLISRRDKKILLVQEGNPVCLGKWSFPGGNKNIGETTMDAIVREVREEVTVDIALISWLGFYEKPFDDRLGIIFIAEIKNGEAAVGEEIIDFQWLSYAEIKKIYKRGRLRASYILKAIDDFNRGKRYPLEAITVLS